MIQLILPNPADFMILADRVQALLIPSKVSTDASGSQPILIDEGKTITGKVDIDTYLDDLEHFSKQWYACRCDMFP